MHLWNLIWKRNQSNNQPVEHVKHVKELYNSIWKNTTSSADSTDVNWIMDFRGRNNENGKKWDLRSSELEYLLFYVDNATCNGKGKVRVVR